MGRMIEDWLAWLELELELGTVEREVVEMGSLHGMIMSDEGEKGVIG